MKKFLIYLFIFSIPFTIVIPILNLTLDPYSIFKDDYSKNIGSMNERFVKVRYLVTQQPQFNSLLVGSSRVGNIDSRKLTDGKYYNLTCSGSLPYNWYVDLKTLLESGYPVKNILVGIDDISYLRKRNHNNDILFRRPYEMNIFKRCDYYLRYIFRIPKLSEYYKAIKGEKRYDDFPVKYDLINSGIPFKYAKEEYIEKNILAHRKEKTFQQGSSKMKLKNYQEECIEDIVSIKKLCAEYNVTCTFFINPLFIARYLRNDPEGFINFKRELAKVTPYWDFSGFNYVSKDPYYWFERGHYRMNAGNLIVERISNPSKDKSTNGSFGNYITAANSDSIFDQELKEIKKYELSQKISQEGDLED